MRAWFFLLALSLSVSVAAGAFAFKRRRRVPAALPFSLVPLSHAAWTAIEIAQIAVPGLDAKLFLDGLQWLAGWGFVFGSLWFAHAYGGRRMTRWPWALILALPLPVIALLASEPLHHRFHPDAWIRFGAGPPSLEYAWSVLDWGLLIYAYVLLTVACGLVIRTLVHQHAAYVSQSIVVLSGLALAPVMGLVALALGIRSFGQRDPMPLLFGLGDLLVVYGLFRRRLLDLAPVAREAIVDGLPDGVLVCDADARIVDVNAALAAILGRPAAEIVRRPAAKVLATWPALAAASTGALSRAELDLEATDGARCFDIRATVLDNGAAQPLGRVVVLRDVSDRKHAERALETERAQLESRVRERTAELSETLEALRRESRERMETDQALSASERRFRAIFDHSFELMALLDRDGRLLAVNHTALDFAGVDPSAALGQPFWSTPWWSHSAVLRDRVRAGVSAAAAGQVIRFEATHLGRDKAVRYLDFSLKAVYDGPTVELLIAEGRDVTDVRRAERTNTALAERLQHAQRLESIGRLAGGVAHDFNNLLTAILGSAEVARFDLLEGSRPAEALRVIEQAAESAAQLTRHLLAFARRQPVTMRLVDIAAAAAQLEQLLARVVGPRVRLQLRSGSPSWPVQIGDGQLEQVLVNLAVNARDAMPDGGQLTIVTRNVTLEEARTFEGLDVAPGDYLELRVADTGIGMDETVLERIFEPFFTTKKAGKGTGLGLAVVHGIVLQNRGFIDVSSRPGVGTEFRILFPRAAGDAPPGEAAREAPAVVRKRVVLVEDQPAVRAFTRDLLQGMGCEVRSFVDGEGALEALERLADPPHLLVADIVLPGSSGIEVAERFQNRWPALPVLLVSGFSDHYSVDGRDGPGRGVDFLAKPFRGAVFVDKVRAILARHDPDRSVAAPGPAAPPERKA
jgi:PAS domain S-box-containing protein